MTRHNSRKFNKPALCAALFCGIASSPVAAAGAYDHFPGAPIDARTQRVQAQVEELYRQQDYKRALLIYEKELAPSGDKYAQYMVGYMNLTGRGVAEDPEEALAWYRLAAERDDKPFAEERDALAAMLDAGALRRAGLRYVVLWRQLGDRRLLLTLLRKDIAELRRHADVLSGADVSDGALVSGFLGSSSRVDSYRRIRERIESRIDYLDSMPALSAVAESVDTTELRELEESVRKDIAAQISVNRP